MDLQWPLIIFTLCAGCGAGMLVFTGLQEFIKKDPAISFRSLIVALVLLVIGGLASVLHLQQPTNVMAAVANLGSFSGISLELIFLFLCCLVGLVLLLAISRKASSGTTRAFAVLGMLFGLVMCFVVGNGYVMESRANWNTVLLPLGYFFGNLTMGAFAVALVGLQRDKTSGEGSEPPSEAAAAATSEPTPEAVAAMAPEATSERTGTDGSAPDSAIAAALFPKGAILVGLGVLSAVVYLLYGVCLTGVGAGGIVLTVFAVLVGGALPLAAGLLAMSGKAPCFPSIIAGLVGAVVGAVFFRCLMWIAGIGVLDAFGNMSSVLLL